MSQRFVANKLHILPGCHTPPSPVTTCFHHSLCQLVVQYPQQVHEALGKQRAVACRVDTPDYFVVPFHGEVVQDVGIGQYGKLVSLAIS